MASAKKKAAQAAEKADDKLDWRYQPRRPFKRAFIPYDPNAVDAAGGPIRVAKRRQALNINLIEDPAGEDATAPPVDSFEDLEALPPWLREALRDDGVLTPSPVQAQVLPIVMTGQNTIVISAGAEAGSEATSYLFSAALQASDQQALTEEEPGPVALVMAATQESAAAITAAATKLFRYSGRGRAKSSALRVCNVSGAGARSERIAEMTSSGAHIIVGTPKRIHDMAAKYQMSLLRVTLLVLDGADQMLDLGFLSEIQQIAAWTRPERQTMLLSRTWPRQAHDLAAELCLAGGLPVRISFAQPRLSAAADAAKRKAAQMSAAKEKVKSAKAAAPAVPKQKSAADQAAAPAVPKQKSAADQAAAKQPGPFAAAAAKLGAAAAFFGQDEEGEEDLACLGDFGEA